MIITATDKSIPRPVGILLILLMGAIIYISTAQAETTEQKAKREANFKAADVDGDGALTQAEFKVFIDSNADDNIGQAAKLRRFGVYDRAFEKLDKDKSGTVSWSEVMDGLAAAN